jgi:hypothetical protein
MGATLPPTAMQPPTIYFYLPEVYWLADERCPDILEQYCNQEIDGDLWKWHVATHSSLKSDGLFAWVIQPYLHLRAIGFPCQIVSTLPKSGIVIVPRKFVPEHLRPGKNLLIVMIKADCKLHKYAQIHIIENPNEEMRRSSDLWKSHFIPHFPQPGLLPRNSNENRFENISYFGLEANLAPELCALDWENRLKAMDFNWSIVGRDRWHDYTQTDAMVAVRSFQTQGYNWKPASKLFNAWHAGIPAILGRESAYQAERKSKLDYIEVSTPEEIIAALQKLRDEPKLRQAMIENGRLRAERTQPEKIALQWRQFLTHIAVPAYHCWRNSSDVSQQSFALIRYLAAESRELRSQTRKMQGQVRSLVKSML